MSLVIETLWSATLEAFASSILLAMKYETLAVCIIAMTRKYNDYNQRLNAALLQDLCFVFRPFTHCTFFTYSDPFSFSSRRRMLRKLLSTNCSSPGFSHAGSVWRRRGKNVITYVFSQSYQMAPISYHVTHISWSFLPDGLVAHNIAFSSWSAMPVLIVPFIWWLLYTVDSCCIVSDGVGGATGQMLQPRPHQALAPSPSVIKEASGLANKSEEIWWISLRHHNLTVTPLGFRPKPALLPAPRFVQLSGWEITI